MPGRRRGTDSADMAAPTASPPQPTEAGPPGTRPFVRNGRWTSTTRDCPGPGWIPGTRCRGAPPDGRSANSTTSQAPRSARASIGPATSTALSRASVRRHSYRRRDPHRGAASSGRGRATIPAPDRKPPRRPAGVRSDWSRKYARVAPRAVRAQDGLGGTARGDRRAGSGMGPGAP